MNDLRTAAQQALEALKMMRDKYEEYACPACDHADAAIYALKEALVDDAMQKFTDVNQELEAALAEPVQEQPVCDECGKSKHDGWALYCVKCVEPMFAPPQRKPLTADELWSNDEIMSLNADFGWHMETIRMFARAIERAHGIT